MATYGSVCSGIEAATAAWHPLGMRAQWYAEIEAFPSAVLAHHYPEVPNLGDMTLLAAKVLSGSIAAPDVLVGGTPCQAFSVAGMRAGLLDPRGALTIKYVELADAVDHVRSIDGQPPAVVVWENVPGVLSDRGNAFGCFLGALAGEDCELQPAGKRWADAGCVYGPKRTIAWRILDAQYFGLAQRRRRVFVVASARPGFDPAAVLFEREGVRRDTAPRRGEGQDVAGRAPFGPALQCGCGYIHGLSLGEFGCPDCEGEEGPSVEVIAGIPAFGGENQAGSLFRAGALNAHGLRNDFATETFCVHGTQDPRVSTDAAFAMGGNSGQENVVFAIQNATRGKAQNGLGIAAETDPMYTLDQASHHAVCVTGDITHTLKAEGFDGSEDGTGRGQPITQAASGVRRLTPAECERLQGFRDDYTQIPWRRKPASECPDGPRYKAIGNSKAVPVVRWIGRRLLDQLNQK